MTFEHLPSYRIVEFADKYGSSYYQVERNRVQIGPKCYTLYDAIEFVKEHNQDMIQCLFGIH